MIDYETYCKIKHYHQERQLNEAQIAQALALDPRTVAKGLDAKCYRPRASTPRASQLDPYKSLVRQWLEAHPYSIEQVFQRLKIAGYAGGYTIVRNYVNQVRPRRAPAFLTLSFEPGECAQVDWGEYGSVSVGQTRRRLSFFVMVLCYSRLMYVEFTVSQTMEHFLACHQNAFQAFGVVPHKIMVDNLKSAVLKRLTGQAPEFNPRYQDFSNHYGYKIAPCGVGRGNEKGRVENGVGYVKKNFLNGLEIPSFSTLNLAARLWLDEIANVRIHGETHEKPIARFRQEKNQCLSLSALPFDIGTVHHVSASNRFRVVLDTNRYSVPAEYASQRLTLKAYPDELFVFHHDKLIARHPRGYDRHQDLECPDHPKALLEQRRNAREQRLYARFLALSSRAEAFYQGLVEKRLNVRQHVRRIVALSKIYAPDKVDRVLTDCLDLQAFSADYVANLLEQRAQLMPEPGALHLTRSMDLLELDIPEPDLSLYQQTPPVKHSVLDVTQKPMQPIDSDNQYPKQTSTTTDL